MERYETINILADYINAKSYLEIGVQTGKTIRNVNIDHKVGVDPARTAKNTTHYISSDEYFRKFDEKFDIIYVDGLHHHEQCYVDILNAIKCLNEGGIIVVDDIYPKDEKHQRRRPTVSAWTGDVWKSWLRGRSEIKDFDFVCYDILYGTGVISKYTNFDKGYDLCSNWKKMPYEKFASDCENLLNLRTETQFIEDWKK